MGFCVCLANPPEVLLSLSPFPARTRCSKMPSKPRAMGSGRPPVPLSPVPSREGSGDVEGGGSQTGTAGGATSAGSGSLPLQMPGRSYYGYRKASTSHPAAALSLTASSFDIREGAYSKKSHEKLTQTNIRRDMRLTVASI